jgi:hypothetical protein
VDEEMRALLDNLREMVEAELAAKAGKKKKAGGKVRAPARGRVTALCAAVACHPI